MGISASGLHFSATLHRCHGTCELLDTETNISFESSRSRRSSLSGIRALSLSAVLPPDFDRAKHKHQKLYHIVDRIHGN